ncbi:MAG: tRNA adenosine(34) deaminase TadA [Pseudanabaenaceae cyanobacterium bins.68]|nr:tRNA adenosine(34) deaminase TadA [Pseudanabaenaceae cyanobacterium bins.68]
MVSNVGSAATLYHGCRYHGWHRVSNLDHDYWMTQAIALALQAGVAQEVPVGAIIVNSQGQLLSQGQNRRQRDQDPTAHAEILVIRAASQILQDWHLLGCTLYVTLEPCPMCAGAILQARLQTLVYGASDPKTGSIDSVLNLPNSPASFHRLTVISGVKQIECKQLLQNWFKQLRQAKSSASIQLANHQDQQ